MHKAFLRINCSLHFPATLPFLKRNYAWRFYESFSLISTFSSCLEIRMQRYAFNVQQQRRKTGAKIQCKNRTKSWRRDTVACCPGQTYWPREACSESIKYFKAHFPLTIPMLFPSLLTPSLPLSRWLLFFLCN